MTQDERFAEIADDLVEALGGKARIRLPSARSLIVMITVAESA